MPVDQEIEWIKELVRSEEQMEQAGLVDFAPTVDTESLVLSSTHSFLKEIKAKFIQNANIFNQLRGSSHGAIKVYGIAKTHADFMLFRNGYKLIFNMIKPGKIKVSFHHMSTPFLNSHVDAGASNPIKETLLVAAWGAFNEVRWISENKPVNPDHLVKFYIRNLVQNSTK